MEISNFRGKYAFLSNFYMIPIKLGKALYPSAEHAYQASKTMDKKLRKAIAQAKTPKIAKQLGKEVPLRPKWEKQKFEIMYTILRAKFSQHKDLREKLLETGNAKLIEGNTWGDCVWGMCRGKGQNKLGKILMLIREEFSIQDWA